MKQKQLLKHLTKYGCHLKREGRSHAIWTNPKNGERETIPRHTEISEKLAYKICKSLGIPKP